MAKFERIRIRGYRRLAEVSLAVRPLTVLIGPSGVGKTSFLEVWSLLAGAAQGRLSDYLSQCGGIQDVITRHLAESMEIELSLAFNRAGPLVYRLALAPQGPACTIAAESLMQKGTLGSQSTKYLEAKLGDVWYLDPAAKLLMRPDWAYNPFETGLAQVPKMFHESEMFRQVLASSTCYTQLDIGPRAPVRLPQSLRPARLPGPNGEDVVSSLYWLRQSNRDRFDVLEDTLRAAFPDFERLDFPPVAAGMLAMTWKERHYATPLYMHQLSEGTLRFLWLAALLLSEKLSSITLLDEPEVSLHPELLSLLVDMLRVASRRSQIIVATNSDRLVRMLRPEEVLVVNTESGHSRFTWGDELNFERWLSDYTLDELWELSRLRGRL